MKVRQLALVLFATLIGTLSLQSCGNDKPAPPPVPVPTPTPEPEVIVAPKTLDQVIPTELQALRTFAELNGLKADFEATNPAEWSNQHIKLTWKEIEAGKFAITHIKQGEKEESGVTKLLLNDDENQLKHLQEIELKTPNLAELSIGKLPALQKLALIGSEGATIESVDIGMLPLLETLILQKFPKLRTTKGWDKEFKITRLIDQNTSVSVSLYPQLKHLELTGTGITDIYLEGSDVLFERIILKENPEINLINIDELNIMELSLKASDFPKLVTLKLNKMEIKAATTLSISSFSELENLYLTKLKGVSSIELSQLPKLNNATLTDLGLKEQPKIEDTEELRSLDFDNNDLTVIDLSHLPNLRRLNISNNNFSSTDQIKLPASIRALAASGNEKLTKADLSPYPSLESVTIVGYAKGADEINTDEPMSLSELNITGLTKLYRLSVQNNKLTDIVVGDTDFEVLESIDVRHNQLTMEQVARIAKAILPSILEEYLTESEDLGLFPQKDLVLPTTVVDRVLDYSHLLSAFKVAGLTSENIEVEIAMHSDFTHDQEVGKVTFHSSGNAFLTISLKADRYTGVALVKNELITVK